MSKAHQVTGKSSSEAGVQQGLQKLKVFPPQPVLVVVTLIAIVALAGMSAVLLPVNGRLKAAGYDIVEYELAFTAEHADEMLRAWGEANQNLMRDSLFLDFPFLLAYGVAFSGLTLLVGRALGGRLGHLGLVLTLAGLIAALCDAVENLILFTTLGLVSVSPLQPLAAGLCASIKFFLWGVVFVYCLGGGAVWLLRTLRVLPR